MRHELHENNISVLSPLNFEDKFRGSRENIIKRLSIYDSLIDLFIQKIMKLDY